MIAIATPNELKLSAHEARILQAYRSLDCDGKNMAMVTLEGWAILAAKSSKPAPAPTGIRLVTTAGKRVAK